MQGKSILIVRAEVPAEADRPLFDAWYREEHLPDAVKAFKAIRGWRGWSQVEPHVHYAFYEFADAATMKASLTPAAMQPLLDEFDGKWGDRARRARDRVDIVGQFEG